MRASLVSLLRERNSPRAVGGSKKTELCVLFMNKSVQKGGSPHPSDALPGNCGCWKSDEVLLFTLCWSGGAGKPAHGMRISRAEAGPASEFCPPSVCHAPEPCFSMKIPSFPLRGGARFRRLERRSASFTSTEAWLSSSVTDARIACLASARAQLSARGGWSQEKGTLLAVYEQKCSKGGSPHPSEALPGNCGCWKSDEVLLFTLCWSGGAGKPAHGMRISRAEAGPASEFCPPSVCHAPEPCFSMKIPSFPLRGGARFRRLERRSASFTSTEAWLSSSVTDARIACLASARAQLSTRGRRFQENGTLRAVYEQKCSKRGVPPSL